MTEVTPDMDTVLDLLRVRRCLVKTEEYDDGAHWVSYTSLRGHRWIVLAAGDVQGALGFLTMLNKDEL